MTTDEPARWLGIALSDDQLRLVRGIVRDVLPGATVRVFGSRATGRARPFSDLDLLFESPDRLELRDRAALQDRFEASELPFRVDLVDAAGLASGVRERVQAEARLLQPALRPRRNPLTGRWLAGRRVAQRLAATAHGHYTRVAPTDTSRRISSAWLCVSVFW